ncbi:MAG: hypothetical protein V1816_24255 [Pseudomonadota bacterium]
MTGIEPKGAARLYPAVSLAPGVAWAADPAAGPGQAAPMQDIIDIKPPLTLPLDPTILYAVAAGLLLAALVAGLVWLLRRRRKKAAQPPPPVEAHILAAGELESLTGHIGLITPREFYFRLSAIFRSYLEGRYLFPALEMTTEELLPRLESLPIDPPLLAEIKAQSRRADPVKFAGFSVDSDIMSGDLRLVRRFVAETKPREENV